jgi:hypothetical protein
VRTECNEVNPGWQGAWWRNTTDNTFGCSDDGDVRNTIDFMPGYGHSFIPKNRNYTDMLGDASRKRSHLTSSPYRIDYDGGGDSFTIVVPHRSTPPAGVRPRAAYPSYYIIPATTLGFSLSEATPARITVHTLTDWLLATLMDHAQMNAGSHTVGLHSEELSNGTYVIELTAGGTLLHTGVVQST